MSSLSHLYNCVIPYACITRNGCLTTVDHQIPIDCKAIYGQPERPVVTQPQLNVVIKSGKTDLIRTSTEIHFFDYT